MQHLAIRLTTAVAGAALACVVGAPGISYADNRPATAGTKTAQAAPNASAARSLPDGWRRCNNPYYRYSIGYPRHWYTAQIRRSEVCRQFDRQPFTIPPYSEYPMTALNAVPTTMTVRAYVRGATQPEFAVTLLKQNTWVCGRHAVRFETVSTGEGLYPKGTRTYGYAINRNGTAFVVFTMTPPGDSLYARNKVVVDRAVRTLRFR
jgi:hypothetical protein